MTPERFTDAASKPQPDEIQTVRVELVSPDPRPANARDLLKKLVEEQVAKILARRDDLIFQPFFESKRISDELIRLQSVPEQEKWRLYFDKWGCLVCGRSSRKVAHVGCGMCHNCYGRTQSRVKEVIRKWKGKHEEAQYDRTVRDREEIAREALADPSRRLRSGE